MNNDTDLISKDKLNTETTAVVQKIIDSSDISETKDLINIFNLSQAKKNVLRVQKYNGLLDRISDEMIQRFENYPGAFTNSELLNYLHVVQDSIDKANNSVTQVDSVSPISMQQNNVTINMVDGMTKESRDRVLQAIQCIMKQSEEHKTVEISQNEVQQQDDSNR